MAGSVDDGKSSGGCKIQVFRNFHQIGLIGDRFFGKTAEIKDRHDPVANRVSRYVITNFHNIACDFHSWTEGKDRFFLVSATGHQDIGEIESRGANQNPYLPRPGYRTFNLFNSQAIGLSPLAANYSSHCFHSSICHQ